MTYVCFSNRFISMGKQAIVIGGTGLTGSWVIKLLSEHLEYEKIIVYTRRELPEELQLPKVESIILPSITADYLWATFQGDEVYCCIGTTRKKTPNQEEYRSIDFGIPVAVAKLCKEKGIQTYAVVSAIGANAKSSIFYNRLKGEMEEAVFAEQIEHTYILRPSIILGNRQEHRAGERFGILIIKAISFLLIGGLKKYRGVEAKAIAAKMIAMSNSGQPSQVIESDRIN